MDYTLTFASWDTITVSADTSAELEDAVRKAAEVGQGHCTKTVWVDVHVCSEDGSTDYGLTVEIDPDEPECSADEHDWQSPISVVGGIEEAPGIFGHGGGIIVCEVCMNCACGRIVDTWAQRSDTGEEGLKSIEYDKGRYEQRLKEYQDASS